MPYYKKIITSGNLMEVSTYFSLRDVDSSQIIQRGENENDTPDDKRKLNDIQSWKRARRLMKCNFSTANGDWFFTCTHKPGLTALQAEREARNLINRLERRYRRKGLELKYIIITEKQEEWHHHLVLNGGLTYEEIETAWGERGRATGSRLKDSQQFAELAQYFTEEYKPKKGGPPSGDSVKEPRQKYARRWRASRNLKKPEVTRKRVKKPPRPGVPRPPKGYRLLPGWQNGCDMFGNLYQHYECVRDRTPGKANSPRKPPGAEGRKAKGGGGIP